MMPTPGRPDPRDRNRAVRVWTEGDGVPTAVTVATVLLLLVSVLLLIMGVVLWSVDRPEGVDAAHREYIRNRSVNMRVVGTVQIVGALALAWLAPSVRRGYAVLHSRGVPLRPRGGGPGRHRRRPRRRVPGDVPSVRDAVLPPPRPGRGAGRGRPPAR
ncbi:hypothetical protein [Corynebacterium bovis]